MIRRGALAALAPEGTVNGDGRELLRTKSGVARIALPTGAPVIPVGPGGRNRWPKEGRLGAPAAAAAVARVRAPPPPAR